MSTKTGTILVIGLGHCWGGQANVSATHSDAHAPQIYTRLFWCMVVCETRCHQIHSTFPRGLPLLLVDRRIDFWIFLDIFLQSKRSCGVSEDEHLIPLVIWLAFRSSRGYLQSTEQLRRAVAMPSSPSPTAFFRNTPGFCLDWLPFMQNMAFSCRLASMYTMTPLWQWKIIFHVNFLNSSFKPLTCG